MSVIRKKSFRAACFGETCTKWTVFENATEALAHEYVLFARASEHKENRGIRERRGASDKFWKVKSFHSKNTKITRHKRAIKLWEIKYFHTNNTLTQA